MLFLLSFLVYTKLLGTFVHYIPKTQACWTVSCCFCAMVLWTFCFCVGSLFMYSLNIDLLLVCVLYGSVKKVSECTNELPDDGQKGTRMYVCMCVYIYIYIYILLRWLNITIRCTHIQYDAKIQYFYFMMYFLLPITLNVRFPSSLFKVFSSLLLTPWIVYSL
jgi:hypothetical protein